MVNTVTHKYETSDIMGMDAVFVHMALTYYCPKDGQTGPRGLDDRGEVGQAVRTSTRSKPRWSWSKAHRILSLTDTTEQNWINFYDLPQEYVVIIFWDPHCGHCKKELA